MKKYFAAVVAAIYVNLMSIDLLSADVKCELTDHPIMKFNDPLCRYEVTMKAARYLHVKSVWRGLAFGGWSPEVKSVDMLYIIDILKPISDTSCEIYLDLLDNHGFKISSIFTSSVAPAYSGKVRGGFSLHPEQYHKISEIELSIKIKEAEELIIKFR